MKPYYEADGIVIYHGDCLEVLPGLDKVDAIVTDPPYGMNWNTDCTRFSGGSKAAQAKRGLGGAKRGRVKGDARPFDPSPWVNFPRVVMWGSNHYAQCLPVGTTLIWLKRNDAAFGTFLSDAEIAWMRGGHGVYCFRDFSMKADARSQVHPTQKPLPLMRWCIQKAGGEGTILDPFMGSGSTLVAAKNLGRKAIGIEIEEKYCEIAARRLDQTVMALGGA